MTKGNRNVTKDLALAPAPWVDRMTQANKLLAEVAGDPFRASRVWDFAEAARVYAIQVNLGVDAVNHAVAVKLKAQRLLAEAVDAGQAKGEIASRGRPNKAPSPGALPRTLDEIGVGQQRVSESRKIAAAFTDEDIDTAAADASLAREELTSAQMVKRAAAIAKRDRPVTHPAKFSDELLPVFAEMLQGHRRVLDPFAGTGKIHQLVEHGFDTVGVEIEPEWAELHERTLVGDALDLDFDDESFDAICTSPTYGNRLADHHEAFDPASRHSYTHDLGRDLAPRNSGVLQWGDDYRKFHIQAWNEAVRVLRRGGRFVLNISDHIRDGQRQAVSAWHARFLMAQGPQEERGELGLTLIDCIPVATRRLRAGENGDARVDTEIVWVFEK